VTRKRCPTCGAPLHRTPFSVDADDVATSIEKCRNPVFEGTVGEQGEWVDGCRLCWLGELARTQWRGRVIRGAAYTAERRKQANAPQFVDEAPQDPRYLTNLDTPWTFESTHLDTVNAAIAQGHMRLCVSEPRAEWVHVPWEWLTGEQAHLQVENDPFAFWLADGMQPVHFGPDFNVMAEMEAMYRARGSSIVAQQASLSRAIAEQIPPGHHTREELHAIFGVEEDEPPRGPRPPTRPIPVMRERPSHLTMTRANMERLYPGTPYVDAGGDLVTCRVADLAPLDVAALDAARDPEDV